MPPSPGSRPRARLRESIRDVALLIAYVVLLLPMLPWRVLTSQRSARRGQRILDRAGRLPAVKLDIEDGDLVIQPDAVVGRPVWNVLPRVALADLARGDWWSLDEDGDFAAANAPPTEVITLATRAGQTFDVCCRWGDWERRQRVLGVLFEREILPSEPSFEGRRPGLDSLMNLFDLLTVIALLVIAAVVAMIVRRC